MNQVTADNKNNHHSSPKSVATKKKNDFWSEIPDHVKKRIEKSREQVKGGQIKSFEEAKKIISQR